jgi:hypothetical protein
MILKPASLSLPVEHVAINSKRLGRNVLLRNLPQQTMKLASQLVKHARLAVLNVLRNVLMEVNYMTATIMRKKKVSAFVQIKTACR